MSPIIPDTMQIKKLKRPTQKEQVYNLPAYRKNKFVPGLKSLVKSQQDHSQPNLVFQKAGAAGTKKAYFPSPANHIMIEHVSPLRSDGMDADNYLAFQVSK